jgi:hypothetical protein
MSQPHPRPSPPSDAAQAYQFFFKNKPKVFFFFSFITLTATLIIIAYYVVKTLLDDAIAEGATPDDNPNPSTNPDQISELSAVNPRQEERLGLLTAPRDPAPPRPQTGPNYNPYNPFNDSKMVRQNSDDSSAQYFSIGGGIGKFFFFGFH